MFDNKLFWNDSKFPDTLSVMMYTYMPVLIRIILVEGLFFQYYTTILRDS